MEKVALDIENLCKIYPKNFKALDQVSLKVNAGDFHALLGPNGAGKSTLIGIISSLVNKSNGKVEILGIDIDKNHSLAKQKMAMTSEATVISKPSTLLKSFATPLVLMSINLKARSFISITLFQTIFLSSILSLFPQYICLSINADQRL